MFSHQDKDKIMKDKNKNKELLKGKKFFEGIKFWQKQISEVGSLKSRLKRNKAESKKIPQKIKTQVETRTAAERMIIKQLHQEIEQRKKTERVAQDASIILRVLLTLYASP